MALFRLRTTILLLVGLALVGFGVVEARARSTADRGTETAVAASSTSPTPLR